MEHRYTEPFNHNPTECGVCNIYRPLPDRPPDSVPSPPLARYCVMVIPFPAGVLSIRQFPSCFSLLLFLFFFSAKYLLSLFSSDSLLSSFPHHNRSQSIDHVSRKEGHPQHRCSNPVGPHQSPRISSQLTSKSQLGFGTWQSEPGQVGEAVYQALKAGYRHLVSLLLEPYHETATDCRRIWQPCTP